MLVHYLLLALSDPAKSTMHNDPSQLYCVTTCYRETCKNNNEWDLEEFLLLSVL